MMTQSCHEDLVCRSSNVPAKELVRTSPKKGLQARKGGPELITLADSRRRQVGELLLLKALLLLLLLLLYCCCRCC